MGIVAVLTLVLLATLLEMPVWLRVVLIVIGVMILLSMCVVACILDRDAGVYECRNCHKRFVPTMTAYISYAHHNHKTFEMPLLRQEKLLQKETYKQGRRMKNKPKAN
jgi:hypothetical protein